MYLLTIKQREDESLKVYLTRFNKERMMVDDQDEKIILAALLEGIWPRSPFIAELARKTSSTLQEFMDRADGLVNVEDTLVALTAHSKGKSERESRGNQKKDQEGGQKARRDPQDLRHYGISRRHNGNYVHYSSVHNQDKVKEVWQNDENRQ